MSLYAPSRAGMGLANQSASSCRQVTPRLWWVVAVACLQAHETACTTDVDLFPIARGARRSRDCAATAATAAATAGTSNSPTILLDPSRAMMTSDGRCQPGHYVGTFNGTYNSAALGNGAVQLPIAATPSLGRPGLEFWLESIPRNCRSDDEFCADFTVKGGKIRGYANPFAIDSGNNQGAVVAVRFEIDFGGNLDCSRGKFEGRLRNGCYDVATVLFRFEGTAPATYDPASSSFTNGEWVVKELPSDAWPEPTADLGGMGSWQATWANDAEGPAPESIGLCGPPAP